MAIFEKTTRVALKSDQLKQALELYLRESFIGGEKLSISNIEKEVGRYIISFDVKSKQNNQYKKDKRPLQLKVINQGK